MALTDNGHTVVATAIDPDEAVEAARKHQPDACLLDVNFPHANGLAANGLAAIRRIHEVSPNTKVVILSGSISGSLVPDAVAEGAQGFVGKEKPVGVIIEALEMARQGHLAVDLHLLQEALGPHQRRYDGRNRCYPNGTRRATHVSGPHPSGRGPIFAVVGCWLAGHPPDVGLRLA